MTAKRNNLIHTPLFVWSKTLQHLWWVLKSRVLDPFLVVWTSLKPFLRFSELQGRRPPPLWRVMLYGKL
jgi:hypothetical protein